MVNSNVDLTNAIVFSAGCHSGYNIVDNHDVASVTEEPDWAQAFAQKGALLIAGTGYQYGDTDFVAYSERLYQDFAQALREGSGPVSVGDALVRAKQRYLAETVEMRPIHDKVLLESALFGLPMLSVDMPAGRFTPTSEVSVVPKSDPAPANTPGDVLGLTTADATLIMDPMDMTKTMVNAVDNSTVTAVYYQGSDGLIVNPAEPILPLERYNVGVGDTVLRGAGFTGGSYIDVLDVVPFTGAAATELRGIHTPFISNVFFPIVPFQINYFDLLANSTQHGQPSLALIPAQYQSHSSTSLQGTMRVYSSMSFRLFYNDNASAYTNASAGVTNIPALASPPDITAIYAEQVDDTVLFRATVTGDPSAGIQQVWVTYTALTGPYYGRWQSLSLVQDPDDSTKWSGSLPLNGIPADDVRFMVQAANGVGLVTLAANQGAYYQPGVNPGMPSQPAVGEAPTQPTEVTLLSPAANGAYGTGVTFSAQLTSNGAPLAGQAVQFGLTTQQQQTTTDVDGVATATLTIVGQPGDDTIRATFDGVPGFEASAAEAPFTITPIATSLTLETATPTFSANGHADLTLALRDASGRPLREKTVLLVIRDGGGSIVHAQTLITNLFGNAVLSAVNLASGTYTVDAAFGSLQTVGASAIDLRLPRYLASSATLSLISNTPPTANAGGPYEVDEGGSVALDGSASTANDVGQSLTYAWDFDNSGSYQTAGVDPTFTAIGLDGPGLLTVGLQVCDNVLDCSTTTADITIKDVPLMINAVTNTGPVKVNQRVTVSVDATGRVGSQSYFYDCNDNGRFEVGPTASTSVVCVFAAAGVHRVNVRVADGNGGIVTDHTEVRVMAIEPPAINACQGLAGVMKVFCEMGERL